MLGVAVLAFLLPLVASYDLAVGLNSYGRKIFEEDRQASPAIWRQKENVTVVAPDNEVIAKVLVIDMRPEKDGDAQIVDGGEKQKSVTIELKSPTALRGYDFHIEVFAAPAEQTTETENTNSPSEETDLPTIASPTVKCATEGAVEIEGPTQTVPSDTIREARNSVMENNESNKTEIILGDPIDMTNEEAATASGATTLSDISTTVMPDQQSTLSNVPDLPLAGMEGDETRHVRKIGDDMFTSTIDTLLASNMDSTVAPDTSKDDDDEATTVSDSTSTTEQSDETFTVPPNTSNGKDIPDFDDLLSTDGEESRFVRHVNGEIDSTSSDISTTESVETTTVTDTYGEHENETRNSREAVFDPINNATETTEMPQTNDEENQVPPVLQILENGDYNPTTLATDEEEYITESSGDFTTDLNDTTMPPDSVTTPVTSDSSMEEQIRMGRGIMDENDTTATNDSVPNYPLFIDPAALSRPNASDDYVYVPILAVISKQSYPAFRGALDNISMNVAFPSNNLDTNTAVEQQIGFEIPESSDNYNKPVVSLT